ncbi:79cbdec4-4d36-4b36-bb97-543955684f77 [Sclerotinia trifoliorum]|uniref:79cbdec4-4d36-4b36-bb97-543955684f77 n=1 Tax=Sclerotinia trifoliorum TaxID=28548 RepID=A0A8H2ZRI8_9HELO|nr:79cbdec4-4d36-4b36-bb97-543955684f77 [Sclerotinia trifoliorum]
MASSGNDYSYEPLRGPRRAETLPVRFDENLTQIPEIGVHRRRDREQRHVAGIPPPRGVIDDDNDQYNFYDDYRTTRQPYRTVSPGPPPPPPRIAQSRPRSPSIQSTTSIDRRRDREYVQPDYYTAYQPTSTSHRRSVPPPEVFKERIGDDYHLDRATTRESPYYTRRTRSRSRRHSRSRSRTRTRHRYTRSRSSSYDRVPNHYSYDVKYGVPETRTAEIDFGLSMPEPETYSFRLSRHNKDSLPLENIDGSNSGYSAKENPLRPLQPHKGLTMKRPEVDRILRSHYTGDGIMGGMHSVEFTVAPGQAASAGRSPVPLFNWVRFEDASMDFDSFLNGILNLDGLKEGERIGISKLLDRVKRRYDKTLQISGRAKVKRMIPKLLQEPLRDEIPSASSKARKLTWICLPYFCLQKYAPSNVQPSSHPPLTLLQTRQSMTPKERDLRQAVCHLSDTPAGSCFHIGQAWFLILDDSSIISCAGLSALQLNKESISILPYRNDNPDSLIRTLLVSDSGSSLWSFPIEECRTWIDFVKHFFELWPIGLGFEFSYGGKTITSKDWPKIFKQAQSSRVCLEFRASWKSKKPAAGILNSPRESVVGFSQNGSQNSEKDDPDTSMAGKKAVSHDFHVFNWMNTQIDMPNSARTAKDSKASNLVAGVNEILLHSDLQEIDDYLMQKTNISERLTYRACPSHTRKQFYDILHEVESKIQADQSLRATYELQVELANAADTLFEFFLSPQESGPTTEKYWGPLYEIIIAMLPYGLIQLDGSSKKDDLNTAPHMLPERAWSVDTRDIKDIVEWMELIGRRTELFKELLSEVPIAARCEINISEKLPRAWLHLLMALAFTKDMAGPWHTHMNLCIELKNEGMRETIQNLSRYQLSDYVVFSPFDLASLITSQLSQDLTGSCPDICETYIDYMTSLEFDIEADPINREHQGKITDLKQEISVILETLENQREVLNDAQYAQSRQNIEIDKVNRVVPAPKYEYKTSTFVEPRTTNHSGYERTGHYKEKYEDLEAKISDPEMNRSPSNNPRGVQGLLFRESLALIEERIEVFRDINDRANYLENWNLRSIDTNKDRQETAVYAFTIVTIIFLPLSTVASILGMNTNDVRNMDLTQWIFWVIAIPLTIIIITLVLIWSDEWYNFWSGFSNLWGKKAKMKRKYVRLPEEYPRIEGRSGLGLSMVPPARVSEIYPEARRLRRSHTLFGGGGYGKEDY